ncbi:hypothetical protein AB0F13_18815 [Streptomyces sp. NPDC026206]|uniref:hypothetical protein n=1 Tax=Streptomyces sp. NPDC026206 TaxID=3157089 RepID=UPI003403A23B
MAMPELLGVSPSPFVPPPGPRYKARALGVGWVVAALLCAYFSASQASRAAGHVANKGVLTVERCWQHPGSGRYGSKGTECVGSFRTATGRVVRDDAELDGAHVPGERVRVYRAGDSYNLVGWRAFWGWLILFCFGALVACHGLMTIVVGIHATKAEEMLVVQSLVRRTSAAVYVKSLMWSALAGLVLCAMLALVSH